MKLAKMSSIVACAKCRAAMELPGEGEWLCGHCGSSYGYHLGVPVLIDQESPFREMAVRIVAGTNHRKWWKSRPEDRVWTSRSVEVLRSVLSAASPDDADRIAVNIGSGLERVFARELSRFDDVIRVGIPTVGEVDMFGDLMCLPIQDACVDLLLSSSVLEHVPDPERAIQEMSRVVKQGGAVYTEVPFIRGFHMIPMDYQRYTPSGIRRLFERHGFRAVEVGICSGPFNAAVLLFVDCLSNFLPQIRGRRGVITIVSWVLHPFKYLDRLVGQRKWGEVAACCTYIHAARKESAASHAVDSE